MGRICGIANWLCSYNSCRVIRPKTPFILWITQLISQQPKGNAQFDPMLLPSVAALFTELSLLPTLPT